MATKKRKKQIKKAVKQLKGLPTWALAFVAGILVCLALLLGWKAVNDPVFGEKLGGSISDLLNETKEPIEILEEWLFGDPDVQTMAPTVAEGTMQVDIIDVGQGESILITTAEKSVLIDAGENDMGDEVLAHLAKRGITKLDLAIGTHAHSDHIGGMDTVLAEIPTDEFWMGIMPEELVPSTKTYMDVLEQLDIGRVPYREPEVGTQYDLGGGGVLTVFGPQGIPDDLNNCSLVCRIDFGESSFLFSGDTEEAMEKKILKSGMDLDVDVMTMGHHGSSTSSCTEYFKAASPEYAVISCGTNNSYGHPHTETIKKLKNADVLYRRTDINGTVTFVTDGSNIEYSTER